MRKPRLRPVVTFPCPACKGLNVHTLSCKLEEPEPNGPPVKETNPKDAIATDRIHLHLVPSTVPIYTALAFLEGALKYGAYNWRVAGVKASVYKSSIDRHIHKWWNGEWADKTTGVPHLASAIAGLGILLDAWTLNMLEDDRPPKQDVDALLESLDATVKHLKKLYGPGKPPFTEKNSK